ncbi:PIN domain-containing protein [candidate division KSB1 bacterium]|nr:PIN domain-containing protein [candidate division KSB1 bacterium]MBL7093012.1 PIN domain-containing protein [candidate division KSB1 bacterium]
MISSVMLDSGPLGRIAYPRPNPAIASWFMNLLEANVTVIIPEISDYEVRRSLLLEGLSKSISRLDQLKETLTYLPLSTNIMLKAAELWAQARRQGRPTADLQALDGDVILAAQALQVNAIVATENVGHLSLFVKAMNWEQISLDN